MWLSIQIARDEFHWTNGGGSRERGGAEVTSPTFSRQLSGGFFSRSVHLTRHELLCK